MTYEEYFKQNPKARLIAQCMSDNMAKQASMPKQAVNWGAMAGNIGKAIQTGAGKASKAMHAGLDKVDAFGRTMAGKAQRAGKRISDAYQKGYHAWDRVEMYPGSNVSPEKASRMRESLQKLRGRISAAGQIGREVGNAGRLIGRGIKNSPTAQATLAGAGLALGAAGLQNAYDQYKQASAQLTPAMRLMAHIIDGDGEWIAKVAACCKKNGKCSKVEHKQMPGK